jgi:NADH-quinone oxidoreductase subunit L
VGVLTALAASVASLVQANFKRGIAYSTVAQLGYMFAGVGVASSFGAMFHLTTHAAFKALLFLSAGVVIHGMNGEERLAYLRGAGRRYAYSYAGFLIGSLALIGTPLVTAGGFSKDVIIEMALERQPAVGWLLVAGVVLTGLYTGRLFFTVYRGVGSTAPETGRRRERPRPQAMRQVLPIAPTPLAAPTVPEEAQRHDPAGERLMNWALVPLMVFSVVAGYLAWPGEWLQHTLAFALQHPGGEADAGHVNPLGATGLFAFTLGLGGFLLAAWAVQRSPKELPSAADDATVRGSWVRATGDLAAGMARGVSALHNGMLLRYAFGSLVAVALILLVRLVVQ